MAVEHPRVRVVEPRRLDVPREQRLGVAHEELVERVLARDQDRQAVPAPAGTAPLLAQRRHRPGEADGDGGVELADVDPELERVGGRDAEQVALDEAALDLAPLGGRVAGAVRREPLRDLGVDPVGGEAVHELGGAARLREADRAQAAGHEPGHEARGLAQRARRAARAPRRAGPGSRARSSAPRAAPRRRRRPPPPRRRATARARPGSRSSPRRRGTAAPSRTRARGGAGGAARWRRASRTRRGRRAPRRRRRRRGSRARHPSGRGGGGLPRGACPGWSG